MALIQDHMYNLPILDIKWHTGPDSERRIVSSDSRTVKIWCGRVLSVRRCRAAA